MKLVRAGGAVFGLGLASLGYALAEANWFALRRYEVPVLPPGTAPVKLLHLSDLHLASGQGRKAAWVAALGRLQPDLVVTTGDNLSSANAFDRLAQALGPLLELPGAFVFGSNDYFTAAPKNPLAYLWRDSRTPGWRQPDLPVAELRRFLTQAGWFDLNNARASFACAAGHLSLIGLGDPHLNLDREPAPRPAPAPVGTQPVLATIGLVHAPYRRAIKTLVAAGAGLVVAGHTHGGQVALPGHGALVTNCDLPARFAKGLHPVDSPGLLGTPAPDAGPGFIHVSAGLGTSPYAPIRLACRPEASLLTLVSAGHRVGQPMPLPSRD
ncbi:MAG: metallophosphoesterase [Micrococcales bacterium]|nr:metallophosphoesterase [Micrococcales bacterium]